jgi:hypothetical protein
MDVEQQKVKIMVRLRELQRVLAVRGFEHFQLRIELFQHDRECLTYERVIIYDEHFQTATSCPLLSVIKDKPAALP